MPIAFPPPLRDSSYIKQQWLRLASKSFYVVPCPKFSNNSVPNSANLIGGIYGWSLEPCISVQQAVNLRSPNKNYSDVSKTSIINPANVIDELYDENAGYDRDLGQQNLKLTGISYNNLGTPLGNCIVKCFDSTTDQLVGSTISDGSGNWVIYPITAGPYYFVEYKIGSPDVFGTSPNTNIAITFTPGG